MVVSVVDVFQSRYGCLAVDVFQSLWRLYSFSLLSFSSGLSLVPVCRWFCWLIVGARLLGSWGPADSSSPPSRAFHLMPCLGARLQGSWGPADMDSSSPPLRAFHLRLSLDVRGAVPDQRPARCGVRRISVGWHGLHCSCYGFLIGVRSVRLRVGMTCSSRLRIGVLPIVFCLQARSCRLLLLQCCYSCAG